MMSSTNLVFHRPDKELTEILRKNLTGGFTSGTTRYFKKGETRLRDEEGLFSSFETIFPFFSHFKLFPHFSSDYLLFSSHLFKISVISIDKIYIKEGGNYMSHV